MLPPGGREGDPPPWPLGGSAVREDREREIWALLWAKPQAAQWELLGLELEVALYVRRLAEAEAPDSSVALSTLVRQLGESIGLTPPGMLRLRWRIGPAVTTPAAAARPTVKPAARRSARSRLKVVDSAGAGG